MKLKVLMREDYRGAHVMQKDAHLNNPNVEEFTDKSDTQFKKAMKLIVSKIVVQYAEPEERVIT